MATRSPVLEILKASENEQADSALVEGLRRAEPEYQHALVEALLSRKGSTGLLGLIARFHEFEGTIQNQILDQADALFGALRKAVKSRNLQTRRNTLELIGRIGNYRLAYVLSLTLRDGASGIRQRSAEILRDLVDRYFCQEHVTQEALSGGGETGSDDVSVQSFSLARLAEERSYLLAVISEAIGDFDVHHRPEVAETLMWFAHQLSETINGVIGDRLSGCGRMVTSLMQSTTDPRMVPFVYEALAHRDLRGSVVRVVSERRDEAFMHALMREAYLVADPQVRRGIGAIRDVAWLQRGGHPILGLEPRYYSRAVDFVLATAIPLERKVVILRDLLLSGDHDAQRAGLWGLVAIDDDLSTQLIRTVVQWQDPDLAGVAMREMMRRQPKNVATLMGQTRSGGSAAAHHLSDEQIGAYDFDQYWQSFDVLEDEDRRRLGRVLYEAGRGILPSLRSKLVSPKSSDRLRAIQIIGTLRICHDLEEEIYRVAHDSDAFVRSAVMALLGQLPGPTSERILLNGLNDPDNRVQANSIESLEELQALNRFGHVRERLGAKDNRVRANAVKALLTAQTREAGAVLIEMIEHAEPAQRASALWVVQSLKLMSMAGRILWLATHDPDPVVRRRALQAAAELNKARKEAPPEPKPRTDLPQEVPL
jgi:hypothetical protein